MNQAAGAHTHLDTLSALLTARGFTVFCSPTGQPVERPDSPRSSDVCAEPVLTVEERQADSGTLLRRLRDAYTRYGWAFLFDQGRGQWYGLHRSEPRPLVFTSPIALRSAVEASSAEWTRRHG
jgi:hypothetical protein